MAVSHESSHMSGHHDKQRGSYTFSSKPRATDTKYRVYDDQENLPLFGNIMYDKRIRRGNTYAQRNLPLTTQPDPIEQQVKYTSLLGIYLYGERHGHYKMI